MSCLRQQIRFSVLSVLALLLAACTGSNNMDDLTAYVANVKSRPGAEVEPVPEFTPYEGFIYSAASQRSPFQVPLNVDPDSVGMLSQDVQPDFDRVRDELESHPLSELRMVGMLTRSGVYHALIEDALGEVHRVTNGDYLGRNHGQIQNISERQVNLVEIVPSGNGGWVERPQTLTLQ
ncbi:MAG: pilus assembly protein PilP [Gammaproteobacteria bacterium]